MFEVKLENGNIQIDDTYRNYAVAFVKDITGRLPDESDYAYTPNTIVFRRILSGTTTANAVRRFLFCEPKTTVNLPSAGEPGLVVYNAQGLPVYSSKEEYVDFKTTHSYPYPSNIFDTNTTVTGTWPVASPGKFVYVLQNTADIILNVLYTIGSEDIKYYGSRFNDLPVLTNGTYNVFRGHLSTNELAMSVQGVRAAGSPGIVYAFAEYHL